jgi:hypothetical protein
MNRDATEWNGLAPRDVWRNNGQPLLDSLHRRRKPLSMRDLRFIGAGLVAGLAFWVVTIYYIAKVIG